MDKKRKKKDSKVTKKTLLTNLTVYKLKIISSAHVEALEYAFNLIDKDNSGQVSPEELSQVVKKFTSRNKGLSPEQLQDMIAEADEFGDGEINFEEFVDFMVQKITKREDCEENLRKVFNYFDQGGEELMIGEDIKDMMNDNGENVTDEEVAQMVDDIALINEAKINFEDFLRPIKFPEDDK